MAQRAFRRGAHQPPHPVGPGRFLHAHLVARGPHVGFARLQLDRLVAPRVGPAHLLTVQVEVRRFRHVQDLRVLAVDGVALRLHGHALRKEPRHFLEVMAQLPHMHFAIEFFAQIPAREDQRATGVLLLAVAEEIRRVTELRFHLFFAVTIIIIRDNRHNHARLVPAGDLKRPAVIVEFILFAPAHAVPPLPLRRLLPGGQSHRFFGRPDQVRGQNHAPGVSGPVFRVQGRIIFRQQGVSPIAKNVFNEIQIAHEVARHKKTHLHRFFWCEARHRRTHDGPQQQRHKAFCRLGLGGREWQAQQLGRRIERQVQKSRKRLLRHS